MADLDFCVLEVTVIHSLQSYKTAPEKFRNLAAINKYFTDQTTKKLSYLEDANNIIQLEFDNRQLRCELKIIDSTEDNSDIFTFKVWNLPEGTVLAIGDYLLFKCYWESDPAKSTTYHGVIKTQPKSTRASSDLQTVVKGQVVDQDILYNWSVYEKYPKLTYYSEVQDFIENELQLGFTSTIPLFGRRIRLSKPILTRTKSVGVILNEICEQTTLLLDNAKCQWKYINGNNILIYSSADLGGRFLNETYELSVPSINYNDLLEYTDNGNDFTVQVFGIPTLVSGVVFYISCEGVPDWVTTKSAYYVANEIEHNITLTDGYIMKIYCTFTQTDDEDGS